MSGTRKRQKPRAPAQKLRAYCPACGEVQWGYGRDRTLYGDRVHSHFVWALADEDTRERFIRTESLKVVLCDGGKVDLEKDRAP